MTTALYRRYRPETFADVIGQEHVTEPLMQALRTGRVNHAYLFSGPRGCGKTTSARILARCLNCEQGPTPTPCGTCDSCVALARGGPGSVDVIEIDAASHGGVDDARDLRERASFGPASSRYKIYIIDEAHMVTPQGFNALLKIVEEPPEHVKFVFATTEPEKVIGTIRSRTHHYPFRLVPPKKLTDYMERLLEAESVPTEPGVLSFVTRAGGGSVRDSLSVLDQLIAGSGPEGLTYAGAAALLGFTEDELLDGIIEAFAAGDSAGVFRQIDKVIESGSDPRRFVEDLLERLRDLIVVAAVAEGAGAVLRAVPEDQLERMRQQAASFGAGGLSRAADVINAGLTEMTGATSPRLQLELMCARVLLPGIAGLDGYAARLDRMERRLEMGELPPRAQSGPVPHAPSMPPPSQNQTTSPPEPQASSPQHSARTAAPEPADSGGPMPRADERPASQRPHGDRASGNSAAGFAPSGGPDPASQGGAPPAGEAAPDQGNRGAAAARDDSAVDGAPRGVDGGVTEREREQMQAAQTQNGGRPDSPEQRPQQRPTGQPAGPQPGEQDGRPASGGLTTDDVRRAWPDVLDRIFRIKRVTWTLLSQNAQVLDFNGERLLLGASSAGLASTMSRGQHPEVVRQALVEAIGVDVRVEARPMDGRSGDSGQGGPGMGPGGPSGGPVSSGPAASQPGVPGGPSHDHAPAPARGNLEEGSAPAARPGGGPGGSLSEWPPDDDVPPDPMDSFGGSYGHDPRNAEATETARSEPGQSAGGRHGASEQPDQRPQGQASSQESRAQPDPQRHQQTPSNGGRGGWRDRTGWQSGQGPREQAGGTRTAGDPPSHGAPVEARTPAQDAGLATAAAQSSAWGSDSGGDWASQTGPAPAWADGDDSEDTPEVTTPVAQSSSTSSEPTPAWMEDEPETDVEAVYDPLPPRQSDTAFPSQAAAGAPEQPSPGGPSSPDASPAQKPVEVERTLTPRQRAEKAAREAAQRQEDAARAGARFDDTAVSRDDEDIENSDAVGLPVIKSVLGGTVIKDEGPGSGS